MGDWPERLLYRAAAKPRLAAMAPAPLLYIKALADLVLSFLVCCCCLSFWFAEGDIFHTRDSVGGHV